MKFSSLAHELFARGRSKSHTNICFPAVTSGMGEERLAEILPSETERVTEHEGELALLQRALDTSSDDQKARDAIVEEFNKLHEHRHSRLDNIVAVIRQLQRVSWNSRFLGLHLRPIVKCVRMVERIGH